MTGDVLEKNTQRVMSSGRLALVVLICGALGGATALAMVALMFWLCERSWVVDKADSHGISELQSSRLGGISVFLGAIAFYLSAEWAAGSLLVSFDSLLSSTGALPSYLIYALLIAAVGLWDDFVERFRPLVRLSLVLAIAFFALLNADGLLALGAYSWLPYGLNTPLVMVTAGTLVVAGFVNAGNMADGANGLLGIIGIACLSVFVATASATFASLFIMALLIFLVFNVSTGRIFLGDFGAYGLSAIIAFGSMDLYAKGGVTLWFLASLLGYPCVEIIRVIFLRILRKAALLQAADDHLHNYMYQLLRNHGWNQVVANSSTGCVIGIISAGVPAFLVILWPNVSGNGLLWGGYFAVYFFLHLSVAFQLERLLNEN